jgi:hypothetical protein
MRAKIRFFVDGKREEVFEVVDATAWLDQFKTFLESHPEIITADHMIEIEFLDEPDVEQRFFRFGSDPRKMVLPFRVEIR